MQIRILLYAVFFLLFTSVAADAGILSLNYPPDKVVMEFDLISISVSLSEGTADEVKLFINGRERRSVSPEKEFVCFAESIPPGINNIDVTALSNGKEIDRISISAFRRSELIGKYMKVPAGYLNDNFHTDKHPECAMCHKMDPGEFDRMAVNPSTFAARTAENAQSADKASTCYSCHKQITASPYVHGPAAVWSCLSCHDENSEVRYAVPKPDTEMCFKCHTDKKEEWAKKKYIHGPVTIGKCAVCHSPHSSNNPFNLFKPTWQLCTNCHFEKGSGKHVLGDSFSTKGHPTHNKKDPLRAGKELSCASCHNPHASNYPNLWALEAQGIFDLCRKCHYDKVTD